MPKIEKPPSRKAASKPVLSRPRHGHRSSAVDTVGESRDRHDVIDPHPSWLRKWRSLKAEVGGGENAEASREQLRDLQSRIAHTRADTLAGLQAQAELISELAWNDVVAATARQLLAGLKRLQQQIPF